MAKVFVPHPGCTAADGSCFEDGRCLRRCQPTLPATRANSELALAMRLLNDLRTYTLSMRDITRYVDGSSIDYAVQEAKALIERNSP